MPTPLIRYPEDPTGRSPDNFIQGEEHTLGIVTGPYHPIAPIYGPFYDDRETLKVYAGSTELVYGVGYKTTSLVADPTLLFAAGPVAELILVQNQPQGTTIRLEYQNVGGLFQSYAGGIVNLYNAFLADNRPVDFITGLINRPAEWPPSYHLHLLSDVVGWDAVIVAIERLINALTLRNIPAFEALIDWVQASMLQACTEEEILNMALADKAVTLRRLIFAAKTLNFNAITLRAKKPEARQGEFFGLRLNATNFPYTEYLFWTIAHIDTDANMFVNTLGTVLVKDQMAEFRVFTTKGNAGTGDRTFRVQLRRNASNGPVIATSQLLTFALTESMKVDYGSLADGLWMIPTTNRSALVELTPESMFLIQDERFA